MGILISEVAGAKRDNAFGMHGLCNALLNDLSAANQNLFV